MGFYKKQLTRPRRSSVKGDNFISIEYEPKELSKVIQKINKMGNELRREVRKEVAKDMHTLKKQVKEVTPVGKTGQLKRSVGLRSKYQVRYDKLSWRIIFRNKIAPYANAVNFAEWHPRSGWFTEWYDANRFKIKNFTEAAIIKAVYKVAAK